MNFIAKIVSGSTTPTVLSNTTGANCTVTKGGGQYTFTFDADVFDTNTTSVIVSNAFQGTPSGTTLRTVCGFVVSASVIKVNAWIGSSGDANANFELQVITY